MSKSYRIHKQEGAYFLTPTVVNWIDVFSRDYYKQIICNSLNYCIDKKGLEVFAYVIMTNHIHLIARAKDCNLSDIMRDFKKFTSGTILKEIRLGKESRKEWLIKMLESGGDKQKIKSQHQLWQYENHAEEVYSPKFTLSKIKYIHDNPVEAGLVQYPEQYLYSSAGDYAGIKSPVNVSVINLHNLF